MAEDCSGHVVASGERGERIPRLCAADEAADGCFLTNARTAWRRARRTRKKRPTPAPASSTRPTTSAPPSAAQNHAVLDNGVDGALVAGSTQFCTFVPFVL